MRPIRLLFVLTSAVRGGIEEVVLALLRRLDPDDFRLALAAPRPLLDSFAGDLARLPVESLDVHAESWLQRRGVARLGSFFRRFRPDIVNPHLFRATAVAAPLAKLNRVASVVETYHGREGWRQGSLPGAFLPDRLVCRFVDRVIAVSEAARDFLVLGKGYPSRKITVIPNGRDLSIFRPGRHGAALRHELGLGRQVPLAVVVGRLEPQKGHCYLLDAWSTVLQNLPDARLLVVGDGKLRADLEQRTRERGLADRVIFVGFRSDVPRILDAVDLLVLPSLYEGMPLTAIEASAMACPVVATAVDGTPEVIRDGLTGRLVAPAQPRALAEAIVDVLRDPDAARRLGAAGRAYVLERFDLSVQAAATARVYRSLVA